MNDEMNASSRVRVVHLYQRSRKGYLIFYTVTDFLVFFTIFCREARRWEIRIIGVCPMYDHIHVLVECDDPEVISHFVQAYSRLYAEEFNLTVGESGPLFHHRFGRAEREGMKEVRSACSYLYNNPGEKGLCRKAEEYRWTFLAYAVSRNPYSEPLVLSKASTGLRRALKMVDYYRRSDQYLRHRWLKSMFDGLNMREKQQLVDYIISSYNCIDYSRLLSFYDTYSQACLAFASNQGKEFGLKEEFTPGGHKVYIQISSVLRRQLGFRTVYDIFRLPSEKRHEMALLCFKMTGASRRQLEKFFRITLLSRGA